MTNKTVLTASHVRYLMVLKRLKCADGMKSSDIADELKLSRLSVHNMMDTFLFMKYIEKEPGGLVFLTDYGLQRASFFEEQYQKIKRKLFGKCKMDDSVDCAIYAMIAELSDEAMKFVVGITAMEEMYEG